jgi:hypothetical protein
MICFVIIQKEHAVQAIRCGDISFRVEVWKNGLLNNLYSFFKKHANT